MTNPQHAKTSLLERYKISIEIIEAKRLFILLTGERAEQVFDALGELKEKGHELVCVDYKIPKIVERMKSIKRKGGDCPGVYSISTAKDARIAINAGAKFLFTTHTDKGITKKCKREKIFHAAGALTPKEVYEANDLGADAVSVYPCSVMGGVGWLHKLKEMFPGFKLIATDVMTPEEAGDYLTVGAYAVAPIIDTKKTEEARDLIQSFTRVK